MPCLWAWGSGRGISLMMPRLALAPCPLQAISVVSKHCAEHDKIYAMVRMEGHPQEGIWKTLRERRGMCCQ